MTSQSELHPSHVYISYEPVSRRYRVSIDGQNIAGGLTDVRVHLEPNERPRIEITRSVFPDRLTMDLPEALVGDQSDPEQEIVRCDLVPGHGIHRFKQPLQPGQTGKCMVCKALVTVRPQDKTG